MDFINSTNFALTELSIIVILTNLFIAFVFSMIISWVYQKTHRSVSYSSSFVESLVIIGILSAVIMMILGNNLIRALGILGIFTLVRFRSIIKDTKDAAYLIFTIVIGLAVGTSNYSLAGAGLIFITGVIFILTKFNFGSRAKGSYILTCITDENFNFSFFEKIFDKYLAGYKVLQIKSKDQEQVYFFSIQPRGTNKLSELVNNLNLNREIRLVDLLTGREASEY